MGTPTQPNKECCLSHCLPRSSRLRTPLHAPLTRSSRQTLTAKPKSKPTTKHAKHFSRKPAAFAFRNAAETCVEGKLSDCTLPTSGPVATTNGTMAADPCVTKCQEVGCSAAQCGDSSVVGVSAVAIVAAVAAA